MKRHPVDPRNFSLLKSLDQFARSKGLSISDTAAHDELLDTIRSSLQEHVNHKSRLHGFRAESMFAHVAAAMGFCQFISEEDSGAFFDISGELQRPDYRIVTLESERMLVEVKNFYQNRPTKPLSMKGEYLRSLKRYAAINSIPLRLAIYWARWGMWTLEAVS
jgi:hypothetical protein